MNSLIALLIAHPSIIGLVACALIAGLVALLEAVKPGVSPDPKRRNAWGQALVCVILAGATEYARSQQAGVPFNVETAIQWATANIGTSLVVYRAGKRAWAKIKTWFRKSAPADACSAP